MAPRTQPYKLLDFVGSVGIENATANMTHLCWGPAEVLIHCFRKSLDIFINNIKVTLAVERQLLRGSAVDAAEFGVRLLENYELCNAGKGAVFGGRVRVGSRRCHRGLALG
jgi:hypothetical protein